MQVATEYLHQINNNFDKGLHLGRTSEKENLVLNWGGGGGGGGGFDIISICCSRSKFYDISQAKRVN